MNYLTPFNLGLIGAAAVAIVLINFGPAIWAWINKPRATTTTTTTTVKPGVPSRREVLDYLDASYTYFEDEKCKEGMTAIQTAVTHAFHEHDSEGNAVPVAGAK